MAENLNEKSVKLLKFLIDRSEDRGIMANLRCGLVKGKRYRAWPYLGHLGGIGDGHSECAIQTIAGAFATHPNNTHEGNFGSMCRKLIGEDELKKLETSEGIGPISRRFQYLLAADGDEIFDRVVSFILRAKAEEIAVNYTELFTSLHNWQWSNAADRVRTEWARSFWMPTASNMDGKGDGV